MLDELPLNSSEWMIMKKSGSRMSLAIGAAVAAGVLVCTTATPASASHHEPACKMAFGRWYCSNVEGARLEWDSQTAGYLVSDFNWFVCRYEGDPTGGGGPHPNRWIYTLADITVTNGGWGFVKDSDIYSETNPLPTC